MEELTILAGERLSKHLLAEERADLVQRLEVHRGIRLDRGELGVDLLHVTGEIRCEALGAVADVLDTRLNEQLITDVGVDDLEDRLLKRNLSLQIATLEGSTCSLDVDAGSSTTKGLELIEILSRTYTVTSNNRASSAKSREVCALAVRSIKNAVGVRNASVRNVRIIRRTRLNGRHVDRVGPRVGDGVTP